MTTAVLTQQGRDTGYLSFNILTVAAVHHGKQVIGPQRQVSWPVVTVAHIIQCTDLPAQLTDVVIGDVPYPK